MRADARFQSKPSPDPGAYRAGGEAVVRTVTVTGFGVNPDGWRRAAGGRALAVSGVGQEAFMNTWSTAPVERGVLFHSDRSSQLGFNGSSQHEET
ncbi:MAG: hypothetical protein ACREPL_09015 [Rhodanobacteraceae bacterium]